MTMMTTVASVAYSIIQIVDKVEDNHFRFGNPGTEPLRFNLNRDNGNLLLEVLVF